MKKLLGIVVLSLFLQCEVFELKKNTTMKKMMREMFDYYTKDIKSKNKI
jgi:hypothetical protein